MISGGAAVIGGLSALLAAQIMRTTHKDTQNTLLHQEKSQSTINLIKLIGNMRIARDDHRAISDKLKNIKPVVEIPQYEELIESASSLNKDVSDLIKELQDRLNQLTADNNLPSQQLIIKINTTTTKAEVFTQRIIRNGDMMTALKENITALNKKLTA